MMSINSVSMQLRLICSYPARVVLLSAMPLAVLLMLLNLRRADTSIFASGDSIFGTVALACFIVAASLSGADIKSGACGVVLVLGRGRTELAVASFLAVGIAVAPTIVAASVVNVLLTQSAGVESGIVANVIGGAASILGYSAFGVCMAWVFRSPAKASLIGVVILIALGPGLWFFFKGDNIPGIDSLLSGPTVVGGLVGWVLWVASIGLMVWVAALAVRRVDLSSRW